MSRSSTTKDPESLMAAGDLVQAARLYEARHRLDDAVEAYNRAGAWNDAARVLSHQGRFREAGETLLFYLPGEPTPVRQLPLDVRRHALNAALCFARGGARREAVGLLMNLGEHQKAASLLSMAGMRQDAVKAMRGQPIEGSPWPPGVVFPLKSPPVPEPSGSVTTAPPPSWAKPASAERSDPAQPVTGSHAAAAPLAEQQQWGLSDSHSVQSSSDLSAPPSTGPSSPLGAFHSMPSGSMPAVAYDGSGSFNRFEPGALSARPRTASASMPAVEINQLLEIGPGDDRLPGAVVQVLKSKWLQEPLSPRLLQFLDRYVEAGSQGAFDAAERATYYAIARLYEYHDRMGAAKKAYQVAASAGGIADAADRLQKIEKGLVETAEGSWLPLHLVVDGLHHQFASLPGLNELPAMKGAPPTASRPSRRPITEETIDVPADMHRDMTPGRTAAPRQGADETMDFDDYMASLPPSTQPSRSGSSSSRRPSVSRSGQWISSDDMSSLDRSLGDASDTHGPITEGSLVADRYRIESFIGQGGMAKALLALAPGGQKVVLKLPTFDNPEANERLRNEARIGIRLDHEGMVQTLDLFEHEPVGVAQLPFHRGGSGGVELPRGQTAEAEEAGAVAFVDVEAHVRLRIRSGRVARARSTAAPSWRRARSRKVLMRLRTVGTDNPTSWAVSCRVHSSKKVWTTQARVSSSASSRRARMRAWSSRASPEGSTTEGPPISALWFSRLSRRVFRLRTWLRQ